MTKIVLLLIIVMASYGFFVIFLKERGQEMDFKDLKEKCIRKGLERIGLGSSEKERKEYLKREVEEMVVINFPEKVINKVISYEAGYFGHIYREGERVALFVFSPPAGKVFRDC